MASRNLPFSCVVSRALLSASAGFCTLFFFVCVAAQLLFDDLSCPLESLLQLPTVAPLCLLPFPSRLLSTVASCNLPALLCCVSSRSLLGALSAVAFVTSRSLMLCLLPLPSRRLRAVVSRNLLFSCVVSRSLLRQSASFCVCVAAQLLFDDLTCPLES